jgi:hypothetical protein
MVAAAWLVTCLALGLVQAQAPAAAARFTDAQIEDFLLHAKVIKTHGTNKGVTLSIRATLSDGTVTHDAHIQQVDEKKQQFDTGRGVEFNFRDSWMYNVAAYRIDRLIGLNMVPVSVSRRYGSDRAAFTWWIDDVLMEEGDRLKKKIDAPDVLAWNRQMQLVRVFDQLIANTDRNVGNLVITKDWRIWPIDHTRAFRLNRAPKSVANITRCDRQVLEKLKQLDRETLRKQVGDVLTNDEIDAVLARRDAIVKHLDAVGPSVLFDRLER